MILINKRRTSTPLARRPTYLARMARSADEVRAAQRLRFEVFNLELNEGLAESHFTGLDIDPFDAVCQHLVESWEMSSYEILSRIEAACRPLLDANTSRPSGISPPGRLLVEPYFT